ncbi:MAG: hypothetical protein M1305_00865, partial [Candidatus Marsarchaeota archaeon]|nr:hypothetical protein [Candidatus Marsarchaeota archaeon]
ASFIRVQQAYETLVDPTARTAYDLRRMTLDRAESYWSPKITVTMSFGYYGYEVPMETMSKASKDAKDIAARTGIREAEALSHLLLDPLIARTHAELKRDGKNITLLLRLADLYFHTYRSYETLKYYLQALSISRTIDTIEQCPHLERAYCYAQDYWGGVTQFSQFLVDFPSAPALLRGQWRDDALNLLAYAERQELAGATPERRIETMLMFAQKKQELGRSPDYSWHKSLADAAIAIGNMTLAREQLALARKRYFEPFHLPALMRSHVKASQTPQAVALGESFVTPERLDKTLNDMEAKVALLLAELYEKNNQLEQAAALYKKLSRYRLTGEKARKRLERLDPVVPTKSRQQRKTKVALPPGSEVDTL